MNEQEVSAIVDAIRSRKPNGEFYLTEQSCISAITTMKSLEPKVEEIEKIILHEFEFKFKSDNGFFMYRPIFNFTRAAAAIVKYLKER